MNKGFKGVGHKLCFSPDPDKPHIVRFHNLINLEKKPKTCRHCYEIHFNPHWIPLSTSYCYGVSPLIYSMLQDGRVVKITDLYHQSTEYFGVIYKHVFTYNN